MGKTDVNVLRGDACFGLWNWDRIGVVSWKCGVRDQEGWTFWDYLDNHGGNNNQTGVSVVATPVEGLTLGLAIPLSLTHEANNADHPEYGTIKKDGTKTLSGIYAHGAAYVGAYSIEGIGTIKAAVQTLPKLGDSSNTEIAAAFDLTAVENLYASLGARIQTKKEANVRDINAYVRYSMDALAIHAIVGTKLNAQDSNKDKTDGAFGFLFGAGVDYNLENGIGLFADVRYGNGIYVSNNSASKNDCVTFGAGVTKGFSNGVIGVAFEGATNSKSWYAQKDNEQFAWEIPVKFEYWF
jgi:hypothetical protein